MFREDLLAVWRSSNFASDGTDMFSIHKFEISDRNMYVRRFLPSNESTAIASGSRSRTPSRSRSTSGNLSRPTSLLRPGKRVDQKPSLGWGHVAPRQACVVSALLHVGRH